MFSISEETKIVCKEAFQRFIGDGVYVGLFLMSILYIISYMKSEDKKESKIKLIFGIYSVVVLVLNLNPWFTKFITKVLNEEDTYWRVYWMLPIGINIAFMFTQIIFKQEKKAKRIVFLVLIIFIIVISGKYSYNSQDDERFVKVNNYYKVPDNILDIIQYVSSDDEEYKKFAGEEAFMVYTRQIDGKVLLGEGRGSYYSEESLLNVINSGDFDNICESCIKKECNYLVLRTGNELTNEYFLKYGIKKIHENEEFVLYKFNNVFEQ